MGDWFRLAIHCIAERGDRMTRRWEKGSGTCTDMLAMGFIPSLGGQLSSGSGSGCLE